MCLRTLSDYCDVFNTMRARARARSSEGDCQSQTFIFDNLLFKYSLNVDAAVSRFWRNLSFSNVLSGNVFQSGVGQELSVFYEISPNTIH